MDDHARMLKIMTTGAECEPATLDDVKTHTELQTCLVVDAQGLTI